MHYTKDDGPALREVGIRAIKRPNPVYLQQLWEDFTVETDTGILGGKSGDFLAHDPISGHVWPVAANYVEQHYDFVPE